MRGGSSCKLTEQQAHLPHQCSLASRSGLGISACWEVVEQALPENTHCMICRGFCVSHSGDSVMSWVPWRIAPTLETCMPQICRLCAIMCIWQPFAAPASRDLAEQHGCSTTCWIHHQPPNNHTVRLQGAA